MAHHRSNEGKGKEEKRGNGEGIWKGEKRMCGIQCGNSRQSVIDGKV